MALALALRALTPGDGGRGTGERAELFYDRGNHYEFLSLVQELASPGEMRAAQNFDFEFKNVEKQYESYNGINVKLRYSTAPPRLLLVSLSRLQC